VICSSVFYALADRGHALPHAASHLHQVPSSAPSFSPRITCNQLPPHISPHHHPPPPPHVTICPPPHAFPPQSWPPSRPGSHARRRSAQPRMTRSWRRSTTTHGLCRCVCGGRVCSACRRSTGPVKTRSVCPSRAWHVLRRHRCCMGEGLARAHMPVPGSMAGLQDGLRIVNTQ
jgi:hypothetical protein